MQSQFPSQTPAFTGEIPDSLLAQIRRGRCVLFAGAGLSRQVRRASGHPLPAWNDLLREIALLGRTAGYPISDDLLNTIAEGRLLEAGQDLQEVLPAAALSAYLYEIFADPAVRPSAAHLIVPQLRLRAVVTTNYDTLIEDSYNQITGALPVTLTYLTYVAGFSNPMRTGEFFVYKIHGDYRNLSTITLGTRDYQGLIHYNPGYRFLLESIFDTYTVLFVGFGASDPDILHALDALAARFPAQPAAHYLLHPHGNFTETSRRRFKKDRGLEIIEYDSAHNHSQVTAFLTALSVQQPLADQLHLTLISDKGDELVLDTLWSAMPIEEYTVAVIDLARSDQGGWFDNLRAEVELCHVVMCIVGRRHPAEYDLVRAVSERAGKRFLTLLSGGSNCGLPNPASAISVDGEGLWVIELREKLGEIRSAMGKGIA